MCSQVELRIMAHFSGDPGLVAMFATDGLDPFRKLAAQWKGVAPEQASAEKTHTHTHAHTYRHTHKRAVTARVCLCVCTRVCVCACVRR